MLKIKIITLVLLLAFIVLVVSTIGMELTVKPTKGIFKEIHEISGSILIVMTFVHIFMYRKALKSILRINKKNKAL